MKLTSLIAALILVLSLPILAQTSAPDATATDTMGTNTNTNMGKTGEMNASGTHMSQHKKSKMHSMKHAKKSKKY